MYYYGYGFDWTYIVLVLPCILLSLWASNNVNTTFKKYSTQYSIRRITGAEAAVILQNAMDLSVSANAVPVDKEVPDWATAAVSAMNDNGISVDGTATLTRGDVAVILYEASCLADQAPGLSMYQ